MPIKARGEYIDLNDKVNLTVQFKDSNGNPADTDTFPTISIIQPNGLMFVQPTTLGVARMSIGKYFYTLSIPYNGSYGVWNDIWTGTLDGDFIEASFSFVVSHTQIPSFNSDGYMHLGDDVPFQYSQTAIHNINKLLKAVRARLNSSGKAKSTDSYGNVTYVSCDIFSVDMLVTFLAMALTKFNQVPYFTNFQFDDTPFVEQFFENLVQGAVLNALASQSLIERGREYQLSDNGISFTPPTVSELLNTQYNQTLQNYWEELKYIKNSLRPNPLGLGVASLTGGMNPAYRQLRHRRANRLI